jgi:hypothetical protein
LIYWELGYPIINSAAITALDPLLGACGSSP